MKIKGLIGTFVKALVLGVGAVSWISIFENEQIQIEDYEIYSLKLPKAFDGYRIAFLSDLHGKIFGRDNKRLLEQIHALSPDLILVGGDMIVGKVGYDTKTAVNLLKALAKDYPVICANGNHEYRMMLYKDTYGKSYEAYVAALKDAGITYLVNEDVIVSRNGASVTVTGLNIDREYYVRGKKIFMGSYYLNSVIGKKKKGFQILLAHNPYYTKAYANWGADLILSGHNHGGLIRLPFLGGLVSPQLSLFQRYDAGYYKVAKSQIIISRGLGSHTFKIRVNNRPELSMITLKRGNIYGN